VRLYAKANGDADFVILRVVHLSSKYPMAIENPVYGKTHGPVVLDTSVFAEKRKIPTRGRLLVGEPQCGFI
jgi:hypothetical protein